MKFSQPYFRHIVREFTISVFTYFRDKHKEISADSYKQDWLEWCFFRCEKYLLRYFYIGAFAIYHFTMVTI